MWDQNDDKILNKQLFQRAVMIEKMFAELD